MSFTQDQREGIAAIINKGFKKAEFDFKIDVVKWEDIDSNNFWGIPDLVKFADHSVNPIRLILDKISKNRYKDFGNFYRFTSINRANQIINNQAIQLNNLFSNHENDFAEYTELYKRLSVLPPLIPEDYDPKGKNKFFNPSLKTPADTDRENTFVLCFTQDNHNERFWKEYAKEDTGVAIGFRFERFDSANFSHYDFRDVFYDSGYSFEFFNDINYNLKHQYKSFLFFDSIVAFSCFYKRGLYKWENETRLCFRYDFSPLGNGNFLSGFAPIIEDKANERKYIELPLDGHPAPNPFFTLTITEITCGSHVSHPEFELLKESLARNYPKARIWKR